MAYGAYEQEYVHLDEGEQVYRIELRRSIPKILTWIDSQNKQRSIVIETTTWHVVATSEDEAVKWALKTQRKYDKQNAGTDRAEAEGNVWSLLSVEVDEYLLCQYCGKVGGH